MFLIWMCDSEFEHGFIAFKVYSVNVIQVFCFISRIDHISWRPSHSEEFGPVLYVNRQPIESYQQFQCISVPES
jgi:hypothetical protein